MGKRIKVLLAEDDKTTSFISKLVLQSFGMNDISEAFDGKEAYDFVQSDCPDVVFLDINMPVMDGWDFLAETSAKPSCQKMKVVVLTSSIRESDKKRAEQYPFVIDYMEKPLTEEKLAELEVKWSD